MHARMHVAYARARSMPVALAEGWHLDHVGCTCTNILAHCRYFFLANADACVLVHFVFQVAFACTAVTSESPDWDWSYSAD